MWGGDHTGAQARELIMARKTRGEAFRQLRKYLEHDMQQILSLTRGGNYAAALLIAIGSEALARLQGLGKTTIFRRLVMPPLDEHMADDPVTRIWSSCAIEIRTGYT